MTKTLLLLALFLFIGCERSDISTQIIGDWYLSDVGITNDNNFSFSFIDPNKTLITPGSGKYSNYSIFSDTVKITSNQQESLDSYIKFRVRNISSRSLKLELLEHVNGQDFIPFDYLDVLLEQNLLSFSKMRNQNNYVFDRIGFYCTGCFGDCSEYYHEIDINGKLYFDAIDRMDIDGTHSTSLSKKDLNTIIRMIRQVDRDDIRFKSPVDMVDVQYCGMFIKSGDMLIRNSTNNQRLLPIELEVLYRYLTSVHKIHEIEPYLFLDTKFELRKHYDAISNFPSPPKPADK